MSHEPAPTPSPPSPPSSPPSSSPSSPMAPRRSLRLSTRASSSKTSSSSSSLSSKGGALPSSSSSAAASTTRANGRRISERNRNNSSNSSTTCAVIPPATTPSKDIAAPDPSSSAASSAAAVAARPGFKTVLPPVASITSPSGDSSSTSAFPPGSSLIDSLRTGPLSPAMLAGPQSSSHHNAGTGSGGSSSSAAARSGINGVSTATNPGSGFDPQSFRTGFTPDLSNFRTGLTPLAGGPTSFPPPSPNTAAFLATVTNGPGAVVPATTGPTITPNTLAALTGAAPNPAGPTSINGKLGHGDAASVEAQEADRLAQERDEAEVKAMLGVVKTHKVVEGHPRWRTRRCKLYAKTGTCPWESGCAFRHEP